MRRFLVLTGVIGLIASNGACHQGSDVTDNLKPFDPALWRQAASGTVRCDMVDDLRNRVGLDGKTKAEVFELLGAPENDGQGLDHYHLCPSFMDVWILEIRWNNGRVASTIVRDT